MHLEIKDDLIGRTYVLPIFVLCENLCYNKNRKWAYFDKLYKEILLII